MKVALCVDGHDGSGKTTAVKHAVEIARKQLKIPVHTFKFPTSYPTEDHAPGSRAEFHLRDFETALPKLVEELEMNCLVIFDRSFMSTAAYQGFERSQGSFLQDRPFLTYILDRGYKAFERHFDRMSMVRMFCHPREAVNRLLCRDKDGGAEFFDETEEIVKSGEAKALSRRIRYICRAARRAEKKLFPTIIGKEPVGLLPAKIRLIQANTTVLSPEDAGRALFEMACVDIACEYGYGDGYGY